MKVENITLVTEFVLEGLTHQPQWKIPLFLTFLVIYLITIVGNFSLITLIWSDPHLHIPMYLFLSNLAFVDSWLSSTVTPKLLITLSFEITKISLSECLLQFFFLCLQCKCRVLPLDFNGLWSLCSYMQTFTLYSDYDK